MKRSTTNYQLLPISGRTMNRRNEDRQELIYPRQWREGAPSPSREPVECSEFSVLPIEAQPTVVFRDLDRDSASIQAILMLWTIVDMWAVSLYSCLVLEKVRHDALVCQLGGSIDEIRMVAPTGHDRTCRIQVRDFIAS